jgi:hypothetical protein
VETDLNGWKDERKQKFSVGDCPRMPRKPVYFSFRTLSPSYEMLTSSLLRSAKHLRAVSPYSSPKPAVVGNVGAVHLVWSIMSNLRHGYSWLHDFVQSVTPGIVQTRRPWVKEPRARREAHNLQNVGVRVQLHIPCGTMPVGMRFSCRLMTRVHQTTWECVPGYKGRRQLG